MAISSRDLLTVARRQADEEKAKDGLAGTDAQASRISSLELSRVVRAMPTHRVGDGTDILTDRIYVALCGAVHLVANEKKSYIWMVSATTSKGATYPLRISNSVECRSKLPQTAKV